MLPFLRLQVTLLLMSSVIFSFLGPSVACRAWFRKFQKSQETSHSFLMSKEIHIFPGLFAPCDFRWRFWVSDQLFARISMRACSQPILVWFSKALSMAIGREEGVFPFFQDEMP